MSRIGLFFLVCLAGLSAQAQQLPDGFWNAGRSFSIASPQSDQLVLQKHLTQIQLWPGFAVIKNSYHLQYNGTDSLQASFHWADTATSIHPVFGQLHNLPAEAKILLIGNDTIRPVKDTGGWNWTTVFAPGTTAVITTYEICPTSQAKRALEGGLKEQNGLIVSNGDWRQTSVRQVLVELMGGLRQVDLTGVYPEEVLGSRERLIWNDTTSGRDMLIWYQGAPPDFKFDKKVLPKTALLFAEIDKFQLRAFAEESFVPVDKSDFSANDPSGLSTILYFMLFSIPWLMLIAFIIFLLRKPKKQTTI